MSKKQLPEVRSLLNFLEHSTTPYHAVQTVEKALLQAGFYRLFLKDAWNVKPNDRVFVISDDSTIAAFDMGGANPVETGFRLMGAHTDSPNLRVKPNPEIRRMGITHWSVEIYGGVLLHTWLDRDLSLAGRVVVAKESKLQSVLVDFKKPVARIPSLAIHLNRNVHIDGLKLNPQEHLLPLVGLSETTKSLKESLAEQIKAEHGLEVSADNILSWDLCFYDVQKPSLSGLHNEWIQSGRLDNLASCHAGLTALLSSKDQAVRSKGVVFYDHEECGSGSAKGAASVFLKNVLMRLLAERSEENFSRAMSQSMFLSVDMAHAVHPNYSAKHDAEHSPVLGKGPVVKVNHNQSYATDAVGWGTLESLAHDIQVPIQKFVSRNDTACGSTIGPKTASLLGIKTIDLGNPMLAMHSAREMAATADVEPMIKLLKNFF